MPDSLVRGRRRERVVVAGALACLFAPLLASAAEVATRGWLQPAKAIALAFPAILVIVVLIAGAVARRLPRTLDGFARHSPRIAGLWLLLALLAIAQLVRISIFMAEPSARWASAFPPSVEASQHTCLSAYVYAAELHRRGDDASIYQAQTYRDPAAQTEIDHLAPYLGDAFLYPAPFLVIGRVLLLLSDDFLVLRSAWFVATAAVFLVACLVLARWIGGREGLMAGLLLPTVIMAVPTLFNLQFGQVHLVTLSAAMLAMVAFDRQRAWVGGVLLAAAILLKVFPAILLLYLALQRRWRSVSTSLVSIAALSLLSLAILGSEPFVHYLRNAIDIGMGGALASTSMVSLANDFGVLRLGAKLSILGWVDQPESLGRMLLWGYSALLCMIAWFAARREGGNRAQAMIWLGLLALASLRAPAAPSTYIAVSAVWLLSLLAAGVRSVKSRVLWGGLIAWVLLQGLPGAPSPRILIALSFLPQIAFVAVAWRSIFSPATPGAQVRPA